METQPFALTVYPHWAWAIIDGRKRFENRTWSTNYRGKLWIHASGVDRPIPEDAAHLFAGRPLAFVSGAIVGSVELVDVCPSGSPCVAGDPWVSGPLVWVLANPRQLRRPLRVSGNTRLWHPPLSLLKQARYIRSQP